MSRRSNKKGGIRLVCLPYISTRINQVEQRSPDFTGLLLVVVLRCIQS